MALKVSVDKFTGLNEAYGDTEVKQGEAIYMKNFKVTPNFKLDKRIGYKSNGLVSITNTTDGWLGYLGGADRFVFLAGQHIYSYTFTTGVLSDLASGYTLTQYKGLLSFFYFNGVLYILGDGKYKKYDGTTFSNVDGYVPTIAIGAPPTGGGTEFEQLNLLTGKRKMEFVGNGSATTYQLPETSIDADTVLITINGVSKTENTHFTVNRTLGTINFAAGSTPNGAPALNAVVIVTWAKLDANARGQVTNCRFTMDFGPGNDTTVFAWGHPTYQNRRRHCESLNPEYWVSTKYTDIGTNEERITSILAFNANYQIIFKERSSYYSTALYTTLNDQSYYTYPVYDLNETLGCDVDNFAQLINNKPITIQNKQLYLWNAGTVEDERNATMISDRIRITMSSFNTDHVWSFDNQRDQEFMFFDTVGNCVVYNYGNDTFYTHDWLKFVNAFSLSGKNYFITYSSGRFMEESTEFIYDDEDDLINVEAVWKSGFFDFDLYEVKKNVRTIWAQIQPYAHTSITLKCPTNRKNEDDTSIKTITKDYQYFTFEDVDFEDFTFNTNNNPQTFDFDIKAKKFTSIQLIIKNIENEPLTVLSYRMIAETGNMV